MQAALILAGSLFIKAVYMVIVNVRARKRMKTQCLTFGDVVVASTLDQGIQVRNECLVSAGDGYRHLTSHVCHKHCKDLKPCPSGDSIGHCQKCKKFNSANKAADLAHPVVAMKYKKALLSNLESASLIPIIILVI